MIRFTPLLAALALAACVTPEMDAEQGAAICDAAGISQSDPRFADCVGAQVANLQSERIEQRQAFGAAMQAIGGGYAASAQTPRPASAAPIFTPMPRLQANCTTMQTQPGMVMTNCF